MYKFVGAYLYKDGKQIGTIKDNKNIDIIENLLNGGNVKMEREMMDKRFHYYPFSGEIIDEVTGKHYYGSGEICKLLNQESDRADRNAELLYDDSDEYRKLVWERDIYKHFVEETLDVMNKYNVKSLNRLDHILFYARKW